MMILSNGLIREMIRAKTIYVTDGDIDAQVGDWGILLHLDMIGLYPKKPQDAQVGRMDSYYPVVFDEHTRYVEVLPENAYLITMYETVTIPPGYYAEVKLRPEVTSCGGMIPDTMVLCNGEKQTIHVVLRNMANEKFSLVRHHPIAEIVISRVEGDYVEPTPFLIPDPYEMPHETPPWIRNLQEQSDYITHPPVHESDLRDADIAPFADDEWPF